MTQRILIPELAHANIDLLTSQMRTLAPNDCYGVSIDYGVNADKVYIEVSDTVTANLLNTLKSAAASHNPDNKTPEQQSELTGKADIADLLSKADTALTQIATKKTTFNSNKNLANAGDLLLEITDDLVECIKVLKYIVKRIT